MGNVPLALLAFACLVGSLFVSRVFAQTGPAIPSGAVTNDVRVVG
jgi:hypothetical protein